MNLVLVFKSLVWQMLAWVAELAASTYKFVEFPEGLANRIEELTLPLAPLVALSSAVAVGWALLRKKDSSRSGLRDLIVGWVFIGLAVLLASTDLAKTAVGHVESITEGLTEPLLDFSHSRLETLRSERSDENTASDPLGCGAYLDELLGRAEDAPALSRTIDVWMRWAYIPHWRNAGYGGSSGYQSERMYCRTLETQAGFSPSTQSELTVCAHARATTGSSDDCSSSASMLGLQEGLRGPFRKRSLMASADHYLQESAWVICRPPASGGAQWSLSPAVRDYEVEVPSSVLQGDTRTLKMSEINQEYRTCQQWFTGRTGSEHEVQVCPPWGNSNQLCWNPISSIGGNSPPATSVSLGKLDRDGRVFFDLRPSNLENWNSLSPPSADREEWDATRNWITTRDGGGAGMRELLGLFAGLTASTVGLFPVVLGLAGGVAISQSVVYVLMSSVPLIALAGVSRRVRAKALRKVLTVAVAFIAAKVVLLWMMAVYSLLFWAIGSTIGANDRSFWGLLAVAFTPVMATLMLSALAASAATKDLLGGVNVGSGKGLVKLGAGAATGADNFGPVEGAKKGLGHAKRVAGRVRTWSPVRKVTSIPSQVDASIASSLRDRRRQRISGIEHKRYSDKLSSKKKAHDLGVAKENKDRLVEEAKAERKQSVGGIRQQRRGNVRIARQDFKRKSKVVKKDFKTAAKGVKKRTETRAAARDVEEVARETGVLDAKKTERQRIVRDIESVAAEVELLDEDVKLKEAAGTEREARAEDLKELKELRREKARELWQLEVEMLRKKEDARWGTMGELNEAKKEAREVRKDIRKEARKTRERMLEEDKKRRAETRERLKEKQRKQRGKK